MEDHIKYKSLAQAAQAYYIHLSICSVISNHINSDLQGEK